MYKEVDNLVAEKALKYFMNHLWYLTEELVVFGLFSNRLSEVEKAMMAQKLLSQKKPTKYALKKPTFPKLCPTSTSLVSLIGPTSWALFDEILKVDSSWLKEVPSEWDKNSGFCEARDFVRYLKVVNDCAERGVAAIEQYCNILTTDEEKRKWLIHTVQENRAKFPNFLKKTLAT